MTSYCMYPFMLQNAKTVIRVDIFWHLGTRWYLYHFNSKIRRSTIMEPRRRRKEEARDQAEFHKEGSSNLRNKTRRKRTQRPSSTYVLFWAISTTLLVLTTLWIVQIQRWGNPTKKIVSDSRSLLRSTLASILDQRQRKRRLEHRDVYDQAYRLAKEENPLHLPFKKNPYHLTSEYGPGVKCNITALFMDPRLSTLPTGQPAWFALESLATFAPNACILIQTCAYVVALCTRLSEYMEFLNLMPFQFLQLNV